MLKRKFDSYSITRRLYLLFGIVGVLFLTLIVRLGYMQVINQKFYTDKLAKASKTRITTSSVRGQIYDAAGNPLVENTTKQVVTYTRDNKATAGEIRETAQKLLNYVTVSDIAVTDRQAVDYYLADKDVYREVVEKLPKNEKFDTDGNRLEESKIYKAAVESIDPSKLGYTDDEKKAIMLFSQMNAISNFSTGTIQTDPLSTEQVAILASSEKDLPGISISTSWDRKVLDTSLASIVGNISTEKAGLPVEEVDEYLKKG